MNSKKERLIMLLMIIVIFCATIILIAIINLRKKTPNQPEIGSSIVDVLGKIENDSISREAYFDINNCMNQYLNALNIKSSRYYGYDENNTYTIVVEENEIKQNIYKLLSKSYISDNSITLDNLYEYVAVKEGTTSYIPLEARVIQDDRISSFLVHGLVETLEYDVIEEIFAIVNIDIVNERFSIEPINDKYNNITEIDMTRYSIDKEVEKNNYNRFTVISPSYKEIVMEYINLSKKLMFGSPEKAYEYLDKEYREEKFGSIEDFKKYIDEHKDKINGIRLEKYQVTTLDDYTQYVCIDQNENYYIFREKTVLDYSFILDTYTIDIPEFTEKYNSSTDQEKVILNLNKFMLAINDKDYKYAYNVLADSFKENNFKTLESFETYIKENFFNKNKFDYIEFGNEAGTYYTYKVKVTDSESKTNKIIEKTFIMLLGEGTDFKISFNV